MKLTEKDKELKGNAAANTPKAGASQSKSSPKKSIKEKITEKLSESKIEALRGCFYNAETPHINCNEETPQKL